MKIDLLTILGPTATGKTNLAACLAYEIDGEVISADSRQVYRGMNIGTGKDLSDYLVNGKQIPHHLIDIVDAGYEYSVFEYVNDFQKAYQAIAGRKKTPILCGGSGMYLEAVLKGYELKYAPVNDEIRSTINLKSNEELIEVLKSHKSLHNFTDTNDRERLLRAVEIAMSSESGVGSREKDALSSQFSILSSNIIFGIHFERETIRQRITERLNIRLKEGMIDEVKGLMLSGISAEKLKYYGLEYKYIAMYLKNEIDYNSMFNKLNIAIHQFAKRQTTWFRRMEKHGFNIRWINGNLDTRSKVDIILHSIHDSPPI